MKTLVFTAALAITNVALAEIPLSAEGVRPFYVWQEEITQKPGRLLRQEPLEANLVLKNASKGVRILCASDGWNNQAIAVYGEVLLPRGEAPEGGWPINNVRGCLSRALSQCI